MKKDKIFQIGNFVFRLIYPEGIEPPRDFLLFEREKEEGAVPEYTYEIKTGTEFPVPPGEKAAERPDLTVYASGERESRLIGIRGRKGYYACYQEKEGNRAEIMLDPQRTETLHIDPVFTSLFALERQMIRRNHMILHCAYTVYEGAAVLFSAPSETGKTTQANLWETYRGSRTVNGDRALLGRTEDGWIARGWPVCGTSEVCHNEEFPVRAVVMLSQAKKNHGERLKPGQAFQMLYSQITVNRWNQRDHLSTMDLIEQLVREIPVYHLGCDISEQAVVCLENLLYGLGAGNTGKT